MNESDMETTLKVGGDGSQRIFRPSRLPSLYALTKEKEFSPAYELAYPQAKRPLCGPPVVVMEFVNYPAPKFNIGQSLVLSLQESLGIYV
ncbi:hypothetical protein K3495_g1027 [Podosphaera aphanis]|nr:hypothetical protein K3495_g1027 [Podosphaera aphanis]